MRLNLWGSLTIFALLLLLLSRFSRVGLCVTPETAAYQVPPSLGFSRQEHWSGLPFPSPMHESEVTQLCLTLSDPMDCSPPGFSIHGIFQEYWSGLPLPSLLCSTSLNIHFESKAELFNKKKKRKKTLGSSKITLCLDISCLSLNLG